MTVRQVNFAKDGIGIGDRRAIALAEWVADFMSVNRRPASAAEIGAEMERLKKIMPAPEDHH